jgi:hypothetical protein
MCLLTKQQSKMKKQHRIKSDSSELIQTTQPQNLELAQKKALDDCAAALQSIVDLHEIVIATKHPTPGNILDAKKDLWDAMVNLAIVASRGGGYDMVKEILAGYGLEEIF